MRIIESQQDLDAVESQKLSQIIRRIENTPLPDTLRGNEVVLDGVSYELELNHSGKNYQWQLFNEKTKVIESLTNYLLKNEK